MYICIPNGGGNNTTHTYYIYPVDGDVRKGWKHIWREGKVSKKDLAVR
jgi:hypothetical protein